jgi:hypothetical protein
MNYGTLTAGRCIAGVGTGILSSTAPMYISEVAPPNIRGALLVLEQFAIVLGIVVMYFIVRSSYTLLIPGTHCTQRHTVLDLSEMTGVIVFHSYFPSYLPSPCLSPSSSCPSHLDGWPVKVEIKRPWKYCASYVDYPPPTQESKRNGSPSEPRRYITMKPCLCDIQASRAARASFPI